MHHISNDYYTMKFGKRSTEFKKQHIYPKKHTHTIMSKVRRISNMYGEISNQYSHI